MTYTTTSQIIRSAHTANYFVAQNEYVRDRRLSAQARGLMTNLLTRPDNWAINIKFLCAEMRMGVVRVKKTLQELERYGYLIRNRTRDAIGRFIGSDHLIVESPKIKDEDTPSQPFSPTVQFSTVSIPTVSKSTTIRNTENSNYQNEQILNLSPTPQISNISEEEIDFFDFWSNSYSDSSQIDLTPSTLEPETSSIDLSQVELTENPCKGIIPSTDKSSAADYKKTTESTPLSPTRMHLGRVWQAKWTMGVFRGVAGLYERFIRSCSE
jgi:hypothetical protein